MRGIESARTAEGSVSVGTRVARKHYGTTVNRPYNYVIHDPNRK